MPTRKVWDYEIDLKKVFVPRKENISLIKKDEKKRMVQDYQYLNNWLVENNYLLPLILDVIEDIRIKKAFMILDLR